ncbi:protease [Salmonella enterica subsp. enterica serovar Ohio]|nr:protease [Salmonella enterica subsp. enterica serovar Manhattan]EDW9603111.1 protease [Salmonella enterica subsp. enterica serovar Ohio]EEX0125789.1 protease [Salmonella enterica]
MDHRCDPFFLSCFLLIYRKPTPSPDRSTIPVMTTNTLKTTGAPRRTETAALSASLASSGDGWCQLLPAGRVRARDGRPKKPAAGWLINKASCERIKANLAALKQPLLIDYDHHSEIAQEKGIKAIAAGWVKSDSVEWREGQGIFIKPVWTPQAQKHIDDLEYAYLSAKLEYYVDNGEPASIRIASLTNDPAITGMKSVAALSADDLYVTTPSTELTPMNEQLRQLLAALGLTVPDDGELTPELGTAALSALTDIQAKAGKHDELKTQVATLSAELDTAKQANTTATGDVNLTKFVPVETYNTLRTEYAALSAQLGTTTLEQVLDKAEGEGRVFKSERSYLEGLGRQIGVAALSAQLDARQPIAALTVKQTDTLPAPKKQTASAALSAEDIQVMKMLGKTEEEFLKAKGVNP